MSPPMRGRGLKPEIGAVCAGGGSSPPMRGRGLKRSRWNFRTRHSGSPPMRGRGLKLEKERQESRGRGLSPPMRGRGLKHLDNFIIDTTGHVAPHAGAWIETGYRYDGGGVKMVAPHAGAWIETRILFRIHRNATSPPMRGRGLKQGSSLHLPTAPGVAPHAGAWIETSQ